MDFAIDTDYCNGEVISGIPQTGTLSGSFLDVVSDNGDGTYTVNADAAEGAYTVEVTTGDCTASTTIFISGAAGADWSTGEGTFSYCEDETITLVADNPGGQWTCLNGSFVTEPDGTVTFLYDLQGAASAAFAVTYEFEGTCDSQGTKVINVYANPAALTVADIAYCANEEAPEVSIDGDAFSSVTIWNDPVLSDASNIVAQGGINEGVSFPAAAGTYWASQTNINGCESERSIFTVTVNPVPAAPVVADVTNCGESMMSLTVENADADATYSWTGPAGTFTGTSIDLSVTGGSSESYEVVAISSAGCSSDATTVVATNCELFGVSYEITDIKQGSQASYTIVFTISGGSGSDYSFLGTDVDVVDNGDGSYSYTIVNVGDFDGTGFYTFGNSGCGCDDVVVEVVQPESCNAVDDAVETMMDEPVAFINVLANDGVCLEDVTTVFTQGSIPGSEVNFDPDSDLFTYIPAPGYCGTDSFTYTAVDADGNEYTAMVLVTITCPPPTGLQVLEEIDCDSDSGTFEVVFSLSNGSGAYQWRECGQSEWQDVTTDDVLVTFGTFVVGPFNEFSTYCVEVRDMTDAGTVLTYDNAGEPVSCVKTSIDLLSFTGEVLEEGNLLIWVTASEDRNDYFTLQRSKDGEVFIDIAELEGRELSNTALSYDHLDEDAPVGISYYRLLETNMDGETTVASRVIALNREGGMDITIVPVPSSDDINVSFDVSNRAEEVSIRIYDVTGKLVALQPVDVTEGLNSLTIDIRQYAAGTYLLTIVDGDEISSQRFVKD